MTGATTAAPAPTHISTAFAMGAVYAALPTGCISPSVRGGTYYLYGSTWFQPAYGANGVYYRVVQVPYGTPRVDLLRSRGATFGDKLTANWQSCASHGMVGVAAGSLSPSGPRFAFQHNRKGLGLLDHRYPASVLDNYWRRAYDQRRSIEL